MPSLSGLARSLHEQHGLESQDVRTDQRLEDIENARMEQVSFVKLQLAVEHMDAQEEIGLFLGREVRGWGGQFLGRDAAGMIAALQQVP